tara:strand:+ start:272 stop:436 length:165 start_codon:yes stop_codon:yes gene_type:complete
MSDEEKMSDLNDYIQHELAMIKHKVKDELIYNAQVKELQLLLDDLRRINKRYGN